VFKPIKRVRYSIGWKLIVTVGVILSLSISAWAYFNIEYQGETLMGGVVSNADRLSETIILGTHYAMMLNSRDDIYQIIQNIGRQRDIQNVRIYNKEGQIKFSNEIAEVDRVTNIKDEACYICHRTDPPVADLSLAERIRIFETPEGRRRLGIISPIRNEPGCATDSCHVHPEGKKILGALDVVFSLDETDREIVRFERWMTFFAGSVFLLTVGIIFVYVLRFVHHPINKLIDGTRRIAKGDYETQVDVRQHDEIGELSAAVNKMGKEIGEKQAELNRQRDEYQHLFEAVPCLITVQDLNYRLLRFNREFQETFDPRAGDFCYHAYKGRSEKCEVCPVARTFEDGEPHTSEESGVRKDGSRVHWLVRSSPIRNDHGQVVAAMEISLDITPRKRLEEELKKSEQKYYAIFNNIPNPVFVLDRESLEILDCNESVPAVYGFDKGDMINRSFLTLFREEERDHFAQKIRTESVINQVGHRGRGDRHLFVNIRVSPAEYQDRRVFLVTTSDITQRLETEQQLIQASKMATLGEMATGVAHELNQPLSVIKTSSGFFMKKIRKKEPIKEEILYTLAEEIDRHVDRATKIINHMRQFGRMADVKMTAIQINDLLRKAFDLFSQQLKVRAIEVDWELQEELPEIQANPDRLEQVFINLLINARDAIEERWAGREFKPGNKKITLRTSAEADQVRVEVSDTGSGIPSNIADRIFEPFFTTKEVGKGTGLGLSISYSIVKEAGGDIRVSTRNRNGATFILTFPIPENHGRKDDIAG
jgi:histidine kinase